MITIEERISVFIEENMNNLIDGWKQGIIVNDLEIQEIIINNGMTLYDIIKESIRSSQSKTTDYQNKLKGFAHQVAEYRATTSKDISNFVFNVNLCRTEIFKHLSKLGGSIEELQEGINKLNTHFDIFIYYAVRHYNKIMKSIIEEQNNYIAQSHQDRLTILGQMTSSFVHECRNPLTSVIGFIQLLKSENPTLPYIDIVQRELDQLKSRMSQFLLLSKNKTNNTVEQFYINELIEETKDFIYPRIVDKGIDLVVSMETTEFTGYRDELKQVLVNIIFNSIEALEQSTNSRKKIVISLESSEDTIVIDISNNGPKIPSESLAKIFEPFVTTKNTGTGLGLYVCKQIIEKHAGNLSCQSDEQLTSFTITLRLT